MGALTGYSLQILAFCNRPEAHAQAVGFPLLSGARAVAVIIGVKFFAAILTAEVVGEKHTTTAV